MRSCASNTASGPIPSIPRDNILAGAAYLAEMFGRYGSSGFLAAYNAGPRRYEELSAAAVRCRSETIDYVARLAPQLGFESLPAAPNRPRQFERRPRQFSSPPRAKRHPGSCHSEPRSRRHRARKRAAPHPLFPAHSDDKIFAQETRSIRTSSDAKAAASVQAANLFVAHSAPGAP